MKKTIAICIFLMLSQITFAQDRPVTVNKLKALIGYNEKDVKKELKSKKYLYDEDDTDENGRYHQYFTDENYDNEIDILYMDTISRGAGFEGMTETEYDQLITWLMANGFYLKTKGAGGTERQDLWEDKNEDWRLVTTYITWPEFKPLRIMLYHVK